MNEQKEPFVAVFYKGLAIVAVLIGIYRAATGGVDGVDGVVIGLCLVLAAAPAAWWLGAVLTLLDRIERNGEHVVEKPRPVAAKAARPVKTAEDSGAFKI